MKTTCSICNKEILKLREITRSCPDSETAAARFENALNLKELKIRVWADGRFISEKETAFPRQDICIDCEIEQKSVRAVY